MKTICIFAVFTLSLVVNGAWWVAAAQPIILTFGAAFAALNLDVQSLIDVDWKSLIVFKIDKEEQAQTATVEEKENKAE